MTEAHPERDQDMQNLETPITGDIPESGPDPEPNSDLTEESGMTENTEDVQVPIGDSGDLPVEPADVEDPSATLGESDETRPV